MYKNIFLLFLTSSLIATEEPLTVDPSTPERPTSPRKYSHTSLTSGSTSVTDERSDAEESSTSDYELEYKQASEAQAILDMTIIFINRHMRKASGLRFNVRGTQAEHISEFYRTTEAKGLVIRTKEYLETNLTCPEAEEIVSHQSRQLDIIMNKYDDHLELLVNEIPLQEKVYGTSMFRPFESILISEDSLTEYLRKNEFFVSFHGLEADEQINEAQRIQKDPEVSKSILYAVQENLKLYRDVIIDKCTPIEIALRKGTPEEITHQPLREALMESHAEFYSIIQLYNHEIKKIGIQLREARK